MVRSHEGGPASAPDQNPLPPDLDPTPDLSPAERADQENRVRDAEILGKSFKVQLTIDRGVTKALSGVHEKAAKFKNAMSTPKNMYLESRYLSAQDKHARKEAKVGSSHFKFINNHHRRVANKYESRMNEKKDAFDSHTNKMQGRLDKAQGHRDKHEQVHKKKIEMYRDRKTMAQGRKEIRKMRGELRGDGKSRIEVNRIVSSISPEQRKQLGAIACRQELAQREVDKTNKSKTRLENTKRDNNDRISYNREAITDKEKTRDRAAENAANAFGLRDELSQEADNLQAELDSGVDASDRDVNDPNDRGTEFTDATKAAMQEKIDKIRADADLADLKAKEFSNQVERLDSEVTALRRDIQARTYRVENLTEDVAEIDTKLAGQDAKVSALAQERQSVIDISTQQVTPRPTPPGTPPVTPAPTPLPVPAPVPAPDQNQAA